MSERHRSWNSSLGLNDLIVLCVSVPMTLSAALLENWIFGTFMCKLVHFTSTLTALISTFTVAVIAVERWFFIVNKQKFDRRCTIFTLIVLWLISILIALPEFISRRLQEVYPQSVMQYMFKMKEMSRERTQNTTNLSSHFEHPLPPCSAKKIVYCVAELGLHMRVFSYIIMTVQYLVPFLFVSISCYSISRFLKRRMHRMRAYQIHQRPTKTSQSKVSKKSSQHADEMTEQELTSYDDLPVTNNGSNSTKSANPILARIRHPFQHRDESSEPGSLHLHDQHHYFKSQSHTERRFHRSRKLLICVAALFTISWLPLTIIQIYLDHNETILETRDGANHVYGYLLIPGYLISSLSAWMNPVIYNYINRSFRREFYALYSCCLPVSAINVRKELTSVASKRPRPEAPHVGELQSQSPPRLGIKHGTHVVSFADETVVMLHWPDEQSSSLTTAVFSLLYYSDVISLIVHTFCLSVCGLCRFVWLKVEWFRYLISRWWWYHSLLHHR